MLSKSVTTESSDVDCADACSEGGEYPASSGNEAHVEYGVDAGAESGCARGVGRWRDCGPGGDSAVAPQRRRANAARIAGAFFRFNGMCTPHIDDASLRRVMKKSGMGIVRKKVIARMNMYAMDLYAVLYSRMFDAMLWSGCRRMRVDHLEIALIDMGERVQLPLSGAQARVDRHRRGIGHHQLARLRRRPPPPRPR